LTKGLINSFKFLAFLVIGVLLLWLAFRNVEIKKLMDGLKEANYSWVLLSLFFAFIAYVSRARRWILLIHPLGYRPTLNNTFHSLMTGYLANLALPRLGEITRCVALGKKEKIPVDQLIGTVMIERTIDFISLMGIMTGLIILRERQIYEFLKASIFIPLREKIFSAFGFTRVTWIFIAVLVVIMLFLIIRYRKNLMKIRFISKLSDVAKGVLNGLKTITNLQNKWEFIFHTVFIWINYALMTWVVVFALKATSHISFGDSIFLLVIGGLAMSAPVQSGLGAFHYIISRGISFIAGVNIEDGLIYAFLTHESQLILVLIIGTISFFMIFRKNEKKKSTAA
jgi:uncharacterized protein (TIRG00374 family)